MKRSLKQSKALPGSGKIQSGLLEVNSGKPLKVRNAKTGKYFYAFALEEMLWSV